MRIRGVETGDIVRVDRRGRIFHALVRGTNPDGGLSLEPLDRRITWRSCSAREVKAHWRRAGKPSETDEPLRPPPTQLALDVDATG